MEMGWRDEHIIPRYNAAGVQKFAFVMPPGMPAIRAEPANEDPATFPTGYFGTRQEALAWLSSLIVDFYLNNKEESLLFRFVHSEKINFLLSHCAITEFSFFSSSALFIKSVQLDG